MGADKTIDLSAFYPVQHLMRNKLSSDGLGGFRGVSATRNFGARERIEHSYTKVILFLVLTTALYSIQTYNIPTLSLILNLQHSNETYRLIKRTRHDYKTVTVVPRNVVFSRSYYSSSYYLLFLMDYRAYYLKWGRPPEPRSQLHQQL